MQALNEDEIFTGELHRLVAENTHLRQVAWRLAIDMRQLELLLRGPNDEEFEAEAENVPCTLSFSDKTYDVQYPDYLLHLANENDLLRSKIYMAEVDIFQMELAVESKQHLGAADGWMKSSIPSYKDYSACHYNGMDMMGFTSCAEALKKGSSHLSPTNFECELPRIKAVYHEYKNALQDNAEKSPNPPRSRTKSSMSTESWSTAHTRITYVSSNTPRLPINSRVPKSGNGRNRKKAIPFMGSSRTVNVDSSSSAFFASLRS